MTLTHQDIAAAHYRALARRNMKPPKLLTKLYPRLRPKREGWPHRPGRIPDNVVRAVCVAALTTDAPHAQIAERYGVQYKAVSQIKSGVRYANLTAELRARGGAM